VAAPRTEITEIVTGLAMLGYRSLDDALEIRPGHILNVAPPSSTVWTRPAPTAPMLGEFDGVGQRVGSPDPPRASVAGRRGPSSGRARIARPATSRSRPTCASITSTS
jgi:hypothetical protein